MSKAKHTAGPLTKAQRKGLEWFALHGETAWFDRHSPSRVVRNRLLADGLIETCGKQRDGMFAIASFRISDPGRAALAKATSGTP